MCVRPGLEGVAAIPCSFVAEGDIVTGLENPLTSMDMI